MTLEEFKKEFKKHHTCGIPFIPYSLSYSSDCPKCAPDSKQWEVTCEDFYKRGLTRWDSIGWREEK